MPRKLPPVALYSPHPSIEYARNVLAAMERKTGKSYEEWVEIAATYVDAMYAAKASLRPIHDQLIALGRALGPDVKVCPCETIVPLYRNHVFGEIKPTTRARIDLGFALKDQPLSGRLQDTGGFAKGDRITRRIPIASLTEIDDEVKHWLRVAYELDV